MKKEDLVIRITKKEEQIKKIEKKIQKWEAKNNIEAFIKEQATWWSNEPKTVKTVDDLVKARVEYFHREDITVVESKVWFANEFVEYTENCKKEIRIANRELEEAKAQLVKYQNQLEVEEQKEAAINELPEIFNEVREMLINAWDLFDKQLRDRIKEEVKKLSGLPYAQWKEARRAVVEKYGWSYEERARETDEHIHQENEKAAKAVILDLVNRVAEKTGEITSYAGLHLDRNNQGYACLNGLVVGKNGKAKVESILAGGYNIQRLHIRVLVH